MLSEVVAGFCAHCGSFLGSREMSEVARSLSMGRVPGLGIRLRAGLLDLLVVLLMRVALGALLPWEMFGGFLGVTPVLGPGDGVWALVCFFYLWGTVFIFGGTLGHLGFGVRVLDESGGRGRARSCLVWAGLVVLGIVVAGVSWWPVAMGGGRRAVHERWSGLRGYVRPPL